MLRMKVLLNYIGWIYMEFFINFQLITKFVTICKSSNYRTEFIV